MEPDLAEITEYCHECSETSYLMRDFKSMAEFLNADEAALTTAPVAGPQPAAAGATAATAEEKKKQEEEAAQANKGTKKEVLAYLEKEIGSEVDVAWLTSTFFLTMGVTSEGMDLALKCLNDCNMI